MKDKKILIGTALVLLLLLTTGLSYAYFNTTVKGNDNAKDVVVEAGTLKLTYTDKLYLLALKEIYTNFSNSYDTAKDLTRQLDYYTAQEVTTSNKSGAIKKNGTSASFWWFRAARSNTTYSFLGVDDYGAWRSNDASYMSGVAPAFRLG